MNVTIIRRWGQNQPGDVVKVDEEQARWLVRHAYGDAASVQASPVQEAFMPGAEGSDPLASGDGSFPGNPVVIKGERRENNAAAVEGSPASVKNGVGSADGPAESASDDEPDGKADKAPARKRRTSSK